MMRFLKNKMCRLLSSAVLLLALAACSDEDTPITDGTHQNGSETSTEKKSYYLAVDVTLPAATSSNSRATTWDEDNDNVSDGDYIYGNGIENGIGLSGHFIFFFDKNRRLQMVYPLSLADQVDMTPGEGDGDKIEVRYWTLIRDIERENLPSWALVVLNGQPVYDAMTSSFVIGVATVDDVLGHVWTEWNDPTKIGRNEDGLFVMTNTSYLKDGVPYCAVPITDLMLHELTDSKDPIPPVKVLPEEEILKIRVERMVAKVTFKMSGGEPGSTGSYIYTPVVKSPEDEDYFDFNHQVNLCTGWEHKVETTEYTTEDGQIVHITTEDWAPQVELRGWKAEVTGWDMNALEREMYIYKKINQSGYDFFSGWNDQAYYRSFWAEDPSYGWKDYPWQYRKAVNQELPYYEQNLSGSDNTNLLANHSYEALNRSNFDDPRYYSENTYDYKVLSTESLDGRRDLLAGTHLIVCAKLLIEDTDGIYRAMDLYRDNRGIYYKTVKDCLWGMVRMFNYTLESQERMRYKHYDWTTSGDETKLYGVPSEGTGDYMLYYKNTPLNYERIRDYLTEDECKLLLAEAIVKNGDGKRILVSNDLSIRNAKGDHLPIYSEYLLGADSETHQRYDNSDFFLRTTEGNNNDVWSLIFEWSSSVDHFANGYMYYPAPARITKDVYGLVRNAWYQYNLTAINSIGIPVDIPTQPIVPNWDTLFDGVNLSVVLIPWHEISGEVPMLPGGNTQ